MLLEEQYSIGPKLGEGTFGVVHLIIEKSTGKKFAMKQLMGNFSTWGDFNSFRELQVLKDLSRHPNIVEIHEVHLTSMSSLFFVFEYMNGGSLYDLIMSRFHHQQQRLQQKHHPTTTNHNMLLLHEDEIRSILQQTLQGLSHMHKEGYMHRDMKPENILVHTGGVYKVADFSLARKYHSHHHDSYTTTTTTVAAAAWWRDHDPLTAYVSTRWYRAPEILLCMQDYGPAIDAYAMGCIAAECFKGTPLFPGKTEIDQLHRIFQLLGEPTRQSLKQGWEQVQASPFLVSSFATPPPPPQTTPPPPRNVITLSSGTPESHVSTSSAEYHKNTRHLLHQAVPMASPQAIDLIVRLLRLDPNKRLTCDQALQHGFLRQSPSSSFLSPPTLQRRHSSLATVREETRLFGEASAVGEPAQHVSPMSETSPAQTVAAPPSTLLSHSKVAAGAASTVATTVSTHDRTLDIPANAATTQDDAMKSSLSFSTSSGSSTMSTSSSSSSSSSSMSSDSSDDDDSSDDESVMSTQKT